MHQSGKHYLEQKTRHIFFCLRNTMTMDKGRLVISGEKYRGLCMILACVFPMVLFQGSLCASFPLFLLKSSFIVVPLSILPFPDTHCFIFFLKKAKKSLNVFLLAALIQPDKNGALRNPSPSPFNPTSFWTWMRTLILPMQGTHSLSKIYSSWYTVSSHQYPWAPKGESSKTSLNACALTH